MDDWVVGDEYRNNDWINKWLAGQIYLKKKKEQMNKETDGVIYSHI